jgi:hypothetical protein
MLMAELSTAVARGLPIKIILLKNNSLAEVMLEQRETGAATRIVAASCRRSISSLSLKPMAPMVSAVSVLRKSVRRFRPALPRLNQPRRRRLSIPKRSPPPSPSCGCECLLTARLLTASWLPFSLGPAFDKIGATDG